MGGRDRSGGRSSIVDLCNRTTADDNEGRAASGVACRSIGSGRATAVVVVHIAVLVVLIVVIVIFIVRVRVLVPAGAASASEDPLGGKGSAVTAGNLRPLSGHSTSALVLLEELIVHPYVLAAAACAKGRDADLLGLIGYNAALVVEVRELKVHV